MNLVKTITALSAVLVFGANASVRAEEMIKSGSDPMKTQAGESPTAGKAEAKPAPSEAPKAEGTPAPATPAASEVKTAPVAEKKAEAKTEKKSKQHKSHKIAKKETKSETNK